MIDTCNVIAQCLIDADITDVKNVYNSNAPFEITAGDLPMLLVSLRDSTGSLDTSYVDSVQVTCIDSDQRRLPEIQSAVVDALDGFTTPEIYLVSHRMTTASFNEQTTPIMYLRMCIFDVAYKRKK